jgi:hypothetical protein
MRSYELVKQNLRYLSDFRQRYALNLKLLIEYTGDSPTAYFRYVRQHSFKGSRIMWLKMIDNPNLPTDITLMHFLGISRRYKIPLEDLLSTDLWNIEYVKYFNMHKVSRNCIRDYIINNQYTVYSLRKTQKMLKSDSDDKTTKLILKQKKIREVKKGTSFNTAKLLRTIKTKNSDRKLKRLKAPE